jgi:uncharacterized protein
MHNAPFFLPVKKLRALDIQWIAKQQELYSGTIHRGDLLRLQKELKSSVEWSIQGYIQDQKHCLHLTAKGIFQLTCQRCLQDFEQTIQFARDFLFVPSEEEALLLDKSNYRQEVLVFQQKFDLLALIEDEFILDIPYIPMHPSCQPPQAHHHHRQTTKALEALSAHPFDVLKSLKTKKSIH